MWSLWYCLWLGPSWEIASVSKGTIRTTIIVNRGPIWNFCMQFLTNFCFENFKFNLLVIGYFTHGHYSRPSVLGNINNAFIISYWELILNGDVSFKLVWKIPFPYQTQLVYCLHIGCSIWNMFFCKALENSLNTIYWQNWTMTEIEKNKQA